MVDYFYTGDYAGESEEESTVDDAGVVRSSGPSIHAAIFALADKYLIKGLELLSVQEYSRSLGQPQDLYSFFTSIPHVYNLTPASSRGLRDQALKFARRELPRLLTKSTTKEAFNNLIDLNPDYTKELLNSFLQEPVIGACYNCNDNPVPVEVLQCRCKRCGKGGARLFGE